MIKYCRILAAIMMVSTLVGCNAMKGAGQDMENTGRNIKETVEKND